MADVTADPDGQGRATVEEVEKVAGKHTQREGDAPLSDEEHVEATIGEEEGGQQHDGREAEPQ